MYFCVYVHVFLRICALKRKTYFENCIFSGFFYIFFHIFSYKNRMYFCVYVHIFLRISVYKRKTYFENCIFSDFLTYFCIKKMYALLRLYVCIFQNMCT